MRKNYSSKTFSGMLFLLVLGAIFWAIEAKTEPIRFPQEGKPAELYSNQTGDDLRQLYLEAIGSAKRSVLLMIYTFTDERLIQVLKEKVREGLDVQIICDAEACRKLPRRLGDSVPLFRCCPDGLMHQKILVVDKQKIWIGSANFTGDSLQINGNLVTAFDSKEMASAIYSKAENMLAESEESVRMQHEFIIGGQKVELYFFPDYPFGVQRLIQLIQAAKKTVRVAMFTWTRFDLARSIVDAHKRGVQTAVAIDNHAGKGAGASVVALLMKGGVPVRFNEGNSLLHYKMLYIDGQTLVNGSANWTKAAFTQNEDCYMILHDLTPTQKQFLERLWDRIVAESI